ncbi:hypothetical protein [Dysgonomonas termitidis]|uniref:Uncharacterized protein n=1 Tax=Dysgonomonas termitidis TaxID=1516126 RepID=A0ABV9KQA0_9BACT
MEHPFYYKLEDIHEKVFERTSLIARSKKVDGVVPEHLIFYRQHDTIFKDLFDNAASDIFDALSGYSKSNHIPDNVEDEAYDERSWFINIDMPDKFDTNQAGYINTEIKNALINNIISAWLMLAGTEDGNIYEAYYTKNISNILFKLSQRNKIIRRPFNSFP